MLRGQSDRRADERGATPSHDDNSPAAMSAIEAVVAWRSLSMVRRGQRA